MKKEEKQTPPVTPDKKQPVEDFAKDSGRQDREQSRTEDIEASNYGDDFTPEEEKKITQESVTFEQDIENAKDSDPERNPQKRKPLGEDTAEIAKQGKDFEPGIDEGNKDAI